jgi:ATP-dependent helicase YprA (DUF1998 family)
MKWASLQIFAMVAPSKVHVYKVGEIDLDDLAGRALAILQMKPFTWQLEITQAVLQGEDVIVDVGTGSGKTLCFALPLLKEKNIYGINSLAAHSSHGRPGQQILHPLLMYKVRFILMYPLRIIALTY